MSIDTSLTAKVSPAMAGLRLDQVCAELFPDYSRSRIQQWIKSGKLIVDGKQGKAKQKVVGGEELTLEPEIQEEGEWLPEEMDLSIVYEDEHILVLNKPAGLVVHPAAGNWTGTLLNGLLHHAPELIHVPRAGIVHRLDKDTTGLMVVAKSLPVQTHLVAQLQDRSVSRQYQAVVHGTFDTKAKHSGTIDAPMGRHPTQRVKMAVVDSGGKEAITHYKLQRNMDGFAHVNLQLETGRTHQIRVHMAHIGYPLVGDQVYGRKVHNKTRSLNPAADSADTFPRQALHAWRLSLLHPITGQTVFWEADLPEDMLKLIEQLSGETHA